MRTRVEAANYRAPGNGWLVVCQAISFYEVVYGPSTDSLVLAVERCQMALDKKFPGGEIAMAVFELGDRIEVAWRSVLAAVFKERYEAKPMEVPRG